MKKREKRSKGEESENQSLTTFLFLWPKTKACSFFRFSTFVVSIFSFFPHRFFSYSSFLYSLIFSLFKFAGKEQRYEEIETNKNWRKSNGFFGIDRYARDGGEDGSDDGGADKWGNYNDGNDDGAIVIVVAARAAAVIVAVVNDIAVADIRANTLVVSVFFASGCYGTFDAVVFAAATTATTAAETAAAAAAAAAGAEVPYWRYARYQ